MIIFTPKPTKYERVPSQSYLNTWNVSHIISNTYAWKFSAYAPTNYTIMFVKEGTFEFKCMHQTSPLTRGDVVVVASSQTFFINDTSEARSELYIVEFDCRIFSFFNLEGYVISHILLSDEHMFQDLENAFRTSSHDYIVDSHLLQILDYIEKTLSENTVSTQLISKIRNYICDHIHERLTAEDISAAFGYNKDYLSRLLKEKSNISLKNLIVTEKIRIAKNLLTFTNYPISKVGKQIGFETANEFNKFFKYHTKMTPSAYKASKLK